MQGPVIDYWSEDNILCAYISLNLVQEEEVSTILEQWFNDNCYIISSSCVSGPNWKISVDDDLQKMCFGHIYKGSDNHKILKHSPGMPWIRYPPE